MGKFLAISQACDETNMQVGKCRPWKITFVTRKILPFLKPLVFFPSQTWSVLNASRNVSFFGFATTRRFCPCIAGSPDFGKSSPLFAWHPFQLSKPLPLSLQPTEVVAAVGSSCYRKVLLASLDLEKAAIQRRSEVRELECSLVTFMFARANQVGCVVVMIKEAVFVLMSVLASSECQAALAVGSFFNRRQSAFLSQQTRRALHLRAELRLLNGGWGEEEDSNLLSLQSSS